MPFVIVFFSLIVLTGCASSDVDLSGAPYFSWPVKAGRMTQGFKSYKKHDGIDIAGKKNTPIYASQGGKVIYAGQGFSGYGKLVIIEHRGDEWASFYAHLNQIKISEGQWVRRGQKIGLMGRTGRATGVHLHFEIRHHRRPVNPLVLLSTNSLLSRR